MKTKKSEITVHKINPHTTHHIGVIVCQGSETPVGINLNGVTLEDANYDLAEGHSPKLFDRWQKSVLNSLRNGEINGCAEGYHWMFIPQSSCNDEPTYDYSGSFPPGLLVKALRIADPKGESKLAVLHTGKIEKGKLDTDNTPFHDSDTYKCLGPIATKMRLTLEGDGQYLKKSVNFLALIERLTGYIMAQQWYQDYEERSESEYPRDDVSLLARDLATQLATDAVQTVNPKFAFE